MFIYVREAPLDGKEQIFLSMKEAISAIRFDFCQYPSQIPLFVDLCPLILGPEIKIVNNSKYDGLWISVPGRRHNARMRNITARDLGHLLIKTLEKSPPTPGVMADICQRIFLISAKPAGNGTGSKAGIRIHADMGGFECRQCGRCCRELDYRHELERADFKRWEKLGRDDILERVATVTRAGRIVSYAIWIEPGTRRFTENCPWLTPAYLKNKSTRWVCRIHDVKPDICRQYPGTRKHARMTGCTGLQN